mmetsp:Transcript_9063/g.16087  ORF Transcript_9063/g.16087 Transcript_9063/m.16087 type:complete len:295 (-) Transcript_9063:173-1057(-)
MKMDDCVKMYEERTDDLRGVGLFATSDIPEGTVILRESPFHNSRACINAALADPLNSTPYKEVNQGITNLVDELKKQTEDSPKADALLDLLLETVYSAEFRALDDSTRLQWMSLHDAFQQVATDIEQEVGIFGLTSEAGKALNGKIGVARYVKARGRFAVTVGDADPVALRRENLKTPYGVVRSNAFDEGLFEKRCRINHACVPNTACFTVTDDKPPKDGGEPTPHNGPPVVLIKATRLIKAGEEITCDYDGPENGKTTMSTPVRRTRLLQKQGFVCSCESCENNEVITKTPFL